jgi:hypothetical protein
METGPPIEQAKVRRSGTSLVITIPSHHVQRLGIEEGNIVDINWWDITKDEKQPAGGSQSKMSDQKKWKIAEFLKDYVKDNPGCTSFDLEEAQREEEWGVYLNKLQVRYFVDKHMSDDITMEKVDGKIKYYPK